MCATNPQTSCKFALSKMFCAALVLGTAASKTSPAQTLTTLYSFCSQSLCSDGQGPHAVLVQGTDGSFYGTTAGGGANQEGVVFRISPSGAFDTIHRVCLQTNCLDGSQPMSALVQATDGNFYGTTSAGGAGRSGTIFKISPDRTFSTLYSFCEHSPCVDGSTPSGALVQGIDGKLYGTTASGGGGGACTNGCGTVFQITLTGALATLHSFNDSDGSTPIAGLVQGFDGNFYGTTAMGWANQCNNQGCGTVFKITSSGAFTPLHSMLPSDGSYPAVPLVQGTDGNLYGTNTFGGVSPNCSGNGCGTVFKITPTGTFTLVYGFQNSPTDGSNPNGLVQATDGNFYGTTSSAGADDGGAIFKLTPGGAETELYSFCSQSNCTDGTKPEAGLLQATDGNFYGTTYSGGAYSPIGFGTVFQFSTGLSPVPWQYVPVTPCRVVDTRNPDGPFGGPPLQAGTYRNFLIPQGACNIPPIASAYSLNVTVVPPHGGTLGYLTIWPAGKSRPLVSTMNSLDGRIKANAAIVPAGASGGVNLYVSNTTDLVLDIDGYFAPPGNSSLAFYPLTPCRVVDTRKTDGPLGGPFLNGRQERDFPVLDSPCIQPHVNAVAYSMNFTVVPVGGPLEYLTLWPKGQSKPLVSTLNNLTATIVANAAIVAGGSGGAISVYPSNDTHLVADIDGYFASPGVGGLSLYPAVPCRVIDTRQVGSGQPFSGTLTPPVDMTDSTCAPQSSAQPYVLNATVVPSGYLGYLTLWPDGEDRPEVSTLNAYDGFVTSNMAIVPNINVQSMHMSPG